LALDVYIDDSGSGDPPVFVLAGFIAEAESWATFTDEWKEELSRNPAIAYFKMKEANSLTGEFDGVSSLARDHKISRLAGLCEKHLAAEVACVMRHSEFAAEFHRRYAPRMDDPYILAMMGIYAKVFDWLHAVGRKSERVNFIFDRQLEKEAIIREMFAEFAKMPGRELEPVGLPPTPNFEDDKETPALQAADLLAWHIRRRFADADSGASATLSAANQFIGKPHRLNMKVWDAEELKDTLGKLTDYSSKQGNFTPYQALWTAKHLDFFITFMNEGLLTAANEKDSDAPIPLYAIQVPQMKRFQLVRTCPHDDSPHLHRRASGACLADS
jgi:hypothetical protein